MPVFDCYRLTSTFGELKENIIFDRAWLLKGGDTLRKCLTILCRGTYFVSSLEYGYGFFGKVVDPGKWKSRGANFFFLDV